MQLLGFDVGGTFIDLFTFDSRTGAISVLKVDSARARLGELIEAGLMALAAAADFQPSDVVRVAHGTTVVTNQIVERTGAKVGVIATKGFRDVTEIGRMRRRSLSDLGQSQPRPLAERDMRMEVGERVAASGVVQENINLEEAKSVVGELARRGAESIAICLLNSYANPGHEELVGDLCKEARIPYSLSSHVSPEYGEYERWSTATLNSYVMPNTRAYLEDVEKRLKDAGVGAQLEVMQSSGGVLPAVEAARFPVRLIGSGPGAGVAAAAQIADLVGCPKIITLDIGGTSADASLVIDGSPRVVSEHSIDEVPVRTIGIDVRSIGAGGGSIAWIDAMGGLQVGPESAGADPGPVCYGRGGHTPTVTDADLVAGYLDPLGFCGGTKHLDVDAARASLTTLAEPLAASVEEVALGVVRVAVTRTTGAIRTITTQAGHDTRDCTLVAFGGAGPTHAAMVAQDLGIPEVIIPPDPALLSARGLLMADYRSDAYRTMPVRLDAVEADRVSSVLSELESEARRQLGNAAVTAEDPRVIHTLEVCYEGQQDLIGVELERFPFAPGDARIVTAALDDAFLDRYQFLPPHRIARLVRLRVTVLGSLPRPPIRSVTTDGRRPARTSERTIVSAGSGSATKAKVYARETLPVGFAAAGPCILQEAYCSTLVLAGQKVVNDELGCLRISPSTGVAH
jgi:N-methylhydantoinase A